MATLQDQGVPISDTLPRGQYGKAARPRVRKATTPTQNVSPPGPASKPRTRQRRSNRSGNKGAGIRSYSPTSVGQGTTGSVGLLEAEFFGALVLLILLMFAGSASYAEKIMSIMKRGTLTCFLFFILALIAGIGPNAAKISKGLGALVIVGILLTTPVEGILTDTDNLIKNDWVGSTEHGTDVGSADSGTSSGSSGSALGAASGAIQRIEQIIGSWGGFT